MKITDVMFIAAPVRRRQVLTPMPPGRLRQSPASRST